MKSENNFNNPPVLISFLVVSLFFMGWQYYLQQKYPDHYKVKLHTATELKEKTQPVSGSSVTQVTASKKFKAAAPSVLNNVEARLITVSNDLYNVQVSSLGMGIENVELKKFTGENSKYVNLDTQFFQSIHPSTGLPIVFNLTENSATEIVGESELLRKTISLNPGSYALSVKVELKGQEKPESISYLSQMKLKEIKNSIFSPSYERQEFFVLQKDQEFRETMGLDFNSASQHENTKILALGSRYFTESVVNRSSVSGVVEVLPQLVKPEAQPVVLFKQTQSLEGIDVDQLRLEYELFLGPKKESLLAQVDSDLGSVIDYGFFEILSRPLMKTLEFFHSIFGNWGWAIVLLTLVIRLLVFPVAFTGYKSMKKMQTIQPALKKIKEKYKDNPQKMNTETMAFMKQNKVNPVGGCLPMLLQIPVLFAFYSLLSESVVMYQAPFIGWIQDLSLKDPYFILPVLMGLAMFIQQKLTPMSMEPLQKKMMMLMPIAFSFFMISLPSALTLYIFVSTLFGIVQQYIFLKMT